MRVARGGAGSHVAVDSQKMTRWGIAGAGDGKFQSDAAYVFCNDKSGIVASPLFGNRQETK